MAPVTICWTQLGSPRARTRSESPTSSPRRGSFPYRPSASGEAAAADDDGRDHVEFEAVGDGRVADRQPRELEDAATRQAPRRSCRRRLSRARPPRRRASPSARWNQWRTDAGQIACMKHDRDGERENRNKPDAPGAQNPRPVRASEASRSARWRVLRGGARRREPVPRTSNIMPSVTMKGTTLSLVMRRPLMNPHTAPAPIPAAAADIGP